MLKYDDEFINTVNAVDAEVFEQDLTGIKVGYTDGELHLGSLGRLSERAQKNMCKWLSIPKGLFNELTEDTLNRAIQERLATKSYSMFRMSKDPSNGDILFAQPYELPYLSYSEILDPIADKIVGIKGDPINSDMIRVVTRDLSINPEGEELYVGQQLALSSISAGNISSAFMTYRLICQNGLMSVRSSQRYKISVENATPRFLAEMVAQRGQDATAYAKTIETFVQETSNTPVHASVDDIMDDLQDTKLVPGSLVNNARIVANRIVSGEEKYDHVGMPNLDTLWMYTNLLTHQAQGLTSQSAREKAEYGAYTWATTKMASV